MAGPSRLRALVVLCLCTVAASARGELVLDDTFATTPFDPERPRWCERYHHGHWNGRAIRLTASSLDARECTAGEGPGSSLSCVETGCDPCASLAGSPCSKVGEPQGNAVILTASDTPAARYAITATFAIERQLPTVNTHLGIYVAMHPHCHTTVQGILAPDRPGDYHLNLAAFNEFIGGDRAVYRSCVDHPLAAISPPLASGISLVEGRRYRWTLRAHLDAAGHVVATTEVADASGTRLAGGSHTFTEADARDWFGVAGRGARFGFGAQLSTAPSPSGGSPAVLLTEIRASAGEDARWTPGPAPLTAAAGAAIPPQRRSAP